MKTRHWNLIQGFALAALLPLFAACSSEGDELLQSEEKQPVQVNITRATMNDGNDWAWQDNDQIKMSITPYGGTATEYTLTYGSNNWKTSPEIGTITLPATAEAWWPSTASASAFSFSHDNQSIDLYGNASSWLNGTVDQSTMQNFAKSDWMTSGQINLSSPSLNIELKHRLCKVTVILDLSEWIKEPTITGLGFITIEDNEISSASSGSNWLFVNPLLHMVEGKQAYSAIISSYYYWGGMFPPLMKLNVNGTDKFVSLPEQMELTLGSAYTFNLTVKNPDATTTRSAGASECELELVKVEDMNKN